jgi:microcompartment protein CcmK/EutM
MAGTSQGEGSRASHPDPDQNVAIEVMGEGAGDTHIVREDIAARRRQNMDDAARADYESKKVALAVALRAGIAIRDAREKACLTRTDLAARMGVSQPALDEIAAGLDTVLMLGVGAGSVSLEAV